MYLLSILSSCFHIGKCALWCSEHLNTVTKMLYLSDMSVMSRMAAVREKVSGNKFLSAHPGS
ncbi:hypothetical protein OTSANNIE_1624 [Anaplasma phagocytophilum str. Annie]|nr:hypothetical protein OTSANNIE_1624 [Anaplasma phagocytophilum str. Annie]